MMKIRKMGVALFVSAVVIGMGLSIASAQEQGPAVNLEEVIVTASRYEMEIQDVPASVTLITREMIENSGSLKVDELLSTYAGIDVTRSSFLSHSADVVLRGMGSGMPGRTLILLDGTPVNKSDTGSANWDLFRPENIERIEIIRGPASVLYGSSAMGGVINIISKKPDERPVVVAANASYGTFDTIETGGGLSGKLNTFGYDISYNRLESDGYNPVPEDERSESDVARYLEEKHFNAKITYAFPNQSNFTLSHLFYDDNHGEGTKIRHDDGVYRKWKTNATNVDYEWSSGSTDWAVKAYYNKEDYFWNRESLRNGAYTWYRVDVDRIDDGASLQATFPVLSAHLVTSGIDYKFGSVDGGDHYIIRSDSASDDVVHNEGKQQTYSLFVNDHYNANDRIVVDAGIRYDYAKSYDGSFSDSSGFLPSDDFADENWSHVSPKIAALYRITDNTTIRGSIGTSFRAPILDDMYRNGILRGKIYAANPDLGPETLISYEAGLDHYFTESFSSSISAYYSEGDDFFYPMMIGIDAATGRDLYQRKNIGSVHIYGFEWETQWVLSEMFKVSANYTHNTSKIDSFSEQPELEGKYLEDSPTHKAGFNLSFYHPSIFRAEISGRYVGERYGDTDNTEDEKLDSYFVANLKLSRDFSEYLSAYVNVDNLFDNTVLYSSDYEGPGSIFRAGISLKF